MTNDLIESAKAVVERWDSPLWKDQPHTAEYIHRLREAISDSELQTKLFQPDVGLKITMEYRNNDHVLRFGYVYEMAELKAGITFKNMPDQVAWQASRMWRNIENDMKIKNIGI